MAIELIEPPKEANTIDGFLAWFQRLYLFVRNTQLRVATSGDENASINKDTGFHGVTSLTASRTLTLPDSSQLEDGRVIEVQDQSGNAGTHNIVIQRSGSDTVNGATSVSITSNYGRMRLAKNGEGSFFAA